MVSMTPGSFWPKREYLREIETIFENTLAYCMNKGHRCVRIKKKGC